MIQVNKATFYVKPVKKIKIKDKLYIFNTITLPIYASYKIKLANGKYKYMGRAEQIVHHEEDLKSKYQSVKYNKNIIL